MERSRSRLREEEAKRPVEDEESESMVVGIENLSIEIAGTEEETAERLEAELGMETEEESEVEGKGEEGVGGTLRELGALFYLTQGS